MTQTIKVSKAGKDVLTETDRNSFVFDSTVNTFKLVTTGTTTGSITADPTTITVAHGQSGVPAFYAFAKFPDGLVALPNEKERAQTDPVNRYWLSEVDSTNLYFLFYKGTSANYGGTVRYYVFEPAI